MMGMSAVQSSAFKAASGEMDISALHLLSLGLLFAVLFLWAAWALLDVWAGWSNEKVRSAMLGRFFIRLALLLVLSIWMFAS